MYFLNLLYRALKSSLFRVAGVYSFFSLLGAGIPFFLLPFMTRYLTPSDYGIVAIFGVMVSLVTPFVGFNVHGAYERAYFASDRFESVTYMGTVSLFVLVNGTALMALFHLFHGIIGEFFSFPASWVWLVPPVAVSSILCQLVLAAWRTREYPYSYGLFQVSQKFFELAGSLFLVVFLGIGWQGRVAASTTSLLFFAGLGIFIVIKNGWFSFSFDKSYLSHAFRFGIPLIPHSLGSILNSSVDRVLISQMVSMTDVGLYTVGFQVGSVVGLLATAFNQAYAPWLYKKLNNASFEEKIDVVRFTYIYFAGIIVFTIFFALLAPFLMELLVGKEFQGSIVFIVWIAMGFSFVGMYFMVGLFLSYAEKNWFLSLATILGCFINITLNYHFIKAWGAKGAAIATTLTNFFVFVFVWYFSAKSYKMPWMFFLGYR